MDQKNINVENPTKVSIPHMAIKFQHWSENMRLFDPVGVCESESHQL